MANIVDNVLTIEASPESLQKIKDNYDCLSKLINPKKLTKEQIALIKANYLSFHSSDVSFEDDFNKWLDKNKISNDLLYALGFSKWDGFQNANFSPEKITKNTKDILITGATANMGLAGPGFEILKKQLNLNKIQNVHTSSENLGAGIFYIDENNIIDEYFSMDSTSDLWLDFVNDKFKYKELDNQKWFQKLTNFADKKYGKDVILSKEVYDDFISSKPKELNEIYDFMHNNFAEYQEFVINSLKNELDKTLLLKELKILPSDKLVVYQIYPEDFFDLDNQENQTDQKVDYCIFSTSQLVKVVKNLKQNNIPVNKENIMNKVKETFLPKLKKEQTVGYLDDSFTFDTSSITTKTNLPEASNEWQENVINAITEKIKNDNFQSIFDGECNIDWESFDFDEEALSIKPKNKERKI